MKKTKIICTLGPSSESEAIITKMVKSGMNVARMNFSHGEHSEHLDRINIVRNVSKKLGVPVAVLLDTKGPEYRIGTFKNRAIFLNDGDDFIFTSKKVEGNQERVSVSYSGIVKQLEPGDIILVNDGLVKFKVVSKNDTELFCKVVIGGKLADRKSMCFPDKVFKQTFLSKQDKEDLLFGIKHDVDFVACSFVSTASDIKSVRAFLDANGGEKIQLIAKIENRAGVDNAEEILKYCEGLMVARGDLGTELPYTELPEIQKKLIALCKLKGGISIVATEMLESMSEKPRPTRAEISDVANAVYDGASAIMLSGESAAGKYPVESVSAMAKIAVETEKNIHYSNRFENSEYVFSNLADCLSHSACQLAINTNAACIVASTTSGQTARMVSRFRVGVPILGLTPDEKAYRQLALSWNVYPMIVRRSASTDDLFKIAKETAKREGFIKKGQTIVITGGMTHRKGQTSLIHADILD